MCSFHRPIKFSLLESRIEINSGMAATVSYGAVVSKKRKKGQIVVCSVWGEFTSMASILSLLLQTLVPRLLLLLKQNAAAASYEKSWISIRLK